MLTHLRIKFWARHIERTCSKTYMNLLVYRLDTRLSIFFSFKICIYSMQLIDNQANIFKFTFICCIIYEVLSQFFNFIPSLDI